MLAKCFGEFMGTLVLILLRGWSSRKRFIEVFESGRCWLGGNYKRLGIRGYGRSIHSCRVRQQ